MNDGYLFTLAIAFPSPEAKSAWLAAPLWPQREALAAAAIDVEEETLFGTESVVVAKSLAAALEQLGLEKRQVASSEKVDQDGQRAMRVVTKGELARDADAKALLAWTKKAAKSGDHDLAVRDAKKKVVLTGYLESFAGYQLLQPAVFLAAASARAVGATALAAFSADDGQSDGPVFDALVADASALRATRHHEAQDLSAAQIDALRARFDIDTAALLASHAAWLARFVDHEERVERAGYTGVIRPDGAFVLAPEHDAVGKLVSGMLPVRHRRDGWRYVDGAGCEIVALGDREAANFSDGLGRIRRHGTYGFYAADGSVAIPETRGYAEDFAEGLAVFADVHDNGVLKSERGYLDRAGLVVVPPRYAEATAFSSGRGRVRSADGSKWGFVDATGAEVIPLRFEQAWPFYGALASAREGGLWGLVDREGSFVMSPRLLQMGIAEDDRAIGKLASGWGVFTSRGDVVIAPEHAEVERRGALYVVMHTGGTRSLFDRDGRVLAGPFVDTLGAPGDGRLPVRPDATGPWGYVDERGVMAIEPRFVHAFSFGSGHAVVVDAKGLAIIDVRGAEVARIALDVARPQAWAFDASGLALVGSPSRFALVATDGRVVMKPYLAGAEEIGGGLVRVTYAQVDP